MTAYFSAAAPRTGRWLLFSMASSALLIAGCSSLTSTAPVSNGSSATAKIGGKVHGGNQPVAGATVSLYFAGQGGTGVGATLVATTTTADDNAGSFSFVKLADSNTINPTTNSFSCPTTGGTPYVYAVARGGNTLNTHVATVNNTASVFIAPFGLCNTITSSSFIYMSEAVTAATVAAVHQYMDVTTGGIGADSALSAYDGLQNAFATVSNLVSLSTGQTLASKAITGAAGGVTVTATPEQAKLNQVANILSACINNASSSASACTTLFASAVPPNPAVTSTPNATFSAATDVLQAAYYVFSNPTNTNTTNLGNLYNLSPATGAPYQPTLTAVPSDWTIGVQYLASGSCGSTGSGFINRPYDINIDQIGNIWIANAQAGNGSLTELSPIGAPLACLHLGGGSRGATIDRNGDVWIGDSENNLIYRYTPSNTTPTFLAFPTSTSPFALAADGLGNIYYSTVSAGSASVWVIPNASPLPVLGSVGVTVPIPPVQISTAVGATPARILVNGDNSIWASTQNSYVSRIVATTDTTSSNYLNGYSTVQISTPSPSYGISADFLKGVFVSAQSVASQVTLLSLSGSSYATASGFPTASNASGLNIPSAVAADGARNVWVANDQPDAGTGNSVVSEFSANGSSLSPNAGTVGGVASAGGYQKPSGYFTNGRTIAVDTAGNVWIGRDSSQAVTEIVGAAVPIFQPYALGILQGRFQTIP